MNKLLRIASVALLLGVGACAVPQLNVKYVDPKISEFKTKGNRVVVGEGSLVGDVLAIEVLKNGKFVIAGHELPREAKAKVAHAALEPSTRVAGGSLRANLLGAPPKPAPAAAAPADPATPAPTEPAPAATEEPAPAAAETEAPGGSYDYVFSVNTSTVLYAPKSNEYPALYSFSVTAASGEIIYIKALSGGDLKAELATTIGELAGLLL